MHVRVATGIDRGDIHSVNWSAFAESEREIVCRLAVGLLSEKSTPQTISLVAETEGNVVGHVAFSPVTIDNSENLQGYILAPLAVKPGFQKHGIGSKLVKSGMQQLSRMGVDILFVYGDPEYYGRFGFSAAVAEGFIPPYALQYPFGWQGIILNECSTVESPAKIACVTSLCDAALW
ncbi:MAG: N-acetyltransferase [Gammaproteobacteria bacterium]|nr:N-acetyltransferase [Gammaproteobacteria bacterium]